MEEADILNYRIWPGHDVRDPFTSLVIESDTGDIVLEKGFYETPISWGDLEEVMRLTHDGFIVVGEHKIHIDALAGFIVSLVNKFQKEERSDKL